MRNVRYLDLRCCLIMIDSTLNGGNTINAECLVNIRKFIGAPPLCIQLAFYLWEERNELARSIVLEGEMNFREEMNDALIDFRCIESGNKFIFFKQADYFENMSNVDATIIFRNNYRSLHIDRHFREQLEFFSNQDADWKQNGHNDPEIETPYRICISNRYRYIIFIDSNCGDHIDFHLFAQEKLTRAKELIDQFLGTHTVEKISMSMLLTNNNENDRMVLGYLIINIQDIFLSNNNSTIKELNLVDSGTGFINFYNEQTDWGIQIT